MRGVGQARVKMYFRRGFGSLGKRGKDGAGGDGLDMLVVGGSRVLGAGMLMVDGERRRCDCEDVKKYLLSVIWSSSWCVDQLIGGKFVHCCHSPCLAENLRLSLREDYASKI